MHIWMSRCQASTVSLENTGTVLPPLVKGELISYPHVDCQFTLHEIRPLRIFYFWKESHYGFVIVYTIS